MGRQMIRLVGVGLLALMGCSGGPKDIPLEEVNLSLKTHRFDLDMARAADAYRKDSAGASQSVLKDFYAPNRDFLVEWLFEGQDSLATDSNIVTLLGIFVANPHGQELLDSVRVHFPEGKLDLDALLLNPFKRYHYYFPEKEIPAIVTYVDGYPPTAQAQLDQFSFTPRFLGVGLHWFMGPNFKYYPPDLPLFLRRRCTIEHLGPLLFRKLAESVVPDPDLSKNPVLMDYVVVEGIRAYFVDRMLPDVPDTLKLFYSGTQLDWANQYEARIYKDMMAEMQSIDPSTIQRYIAESPFTNQLARESAPRLGWFTGLHIIRAYMGKFPEKTLADLVKQTDYAQIFKGSGYRPPKEGAE